MAEPVFPPPGYYWSLNEPPKGLSRTAEAPILNSAFEVRDGVRFLRYQLPEAPVEDAVRIGGYIVSTPAGDLIDSDQKVVGTIDFTTGVFEIEVGLSPDIGSRRVEYTLLS